MRIQSYHLHLPTNLSLGLSDLLEYDPKSIRYLYALRVIRDLVNKISFIFFPIFLYQLGTNLQFFSHISENLQGFMFISAYFLIYHLVTLIIVMPVAQLIGKIGYSRVLLQGYLLYAVVMMCLFFVDQYIWLLLPAVVLHAIQSQCYWLSYHTLLTKRMIKNHTGSSLGALQILLQLASVVTPAIAGIIALNFGIQYLFLFGLIGLLLSAVISLGLYLPYERDKVSWQEMREWLQESSFRKLSLANAGRTWYDVALYFWPLYLFFIIGAVDKVGYIQSIVMFLAMLMTFFIGSYLDKHRSKKPFFLSGGFLAIIWFVRAFIVSVWHITFSDVFDRLVSNFHWLYFDALLFRRGKGSQALSYFTYREVVIAISSIFFYGFFALGFYLGFGWGLIFAFAIIGSFASLFISEHHEQEFISSK